MEVSLAEAARLLGKTTRQVRYMIEQGRLNATKTDGVWHIHSDALPRSPGQLQAQQVRLEQAQQTAEEVLRPHKTTSQRGFRSVRDLRAFEVGRDIHRALLPAVGPEHLASRQLREALEHLACACHEFQDVPRRTHFSAARALMARSVTALLLDSEALVPLADRLEKELLPLLGGLLRGIERRKRT